MARKKVIIASGDPAGCGPLITLNAINSCKAKGVDFFVAGDEKVFDKITLYHKLKKSINFIDSNTKGIEKLRIGFPSKISGWASLNYLKTSLKIIKDRGIKRLVTAPVSKEAVSLILANFSGHTEYLARHFKVRKFAMLMTSAKLRVLLLSRHIRLCDVSDSIKKSTVIDSISLAYSFLKYQRKIKRPRIVLASFNPHAGVDTFLGREEKTLLAAKREFNQTIDGPYPADTIFITKNLKNYDCIICPYHDQAMIPFKLLAFDKGVNVTLGLPIIRTSPAHGVAFDLMRKGNKPSSSSMTEAIKLALKLSL